MATRRVLESVAGAAALMLLCGCQANGGSPTGRVTDSATGTPVGSPYNLHTHCGIHEALVEGTYFVADEVLDDGQGNPPAGWDNPYQAGTISVMGSEATFQDASGHSVTFHSRPGATGFLRTCS